MKKENILNEKTINFIIIVLLVLLNIIIKSIYLNYDDLDGDEPITIYRAVASFPDLYEMLKYETNQPLFFVIMHYWIKVFGIGAVSLRFLPMLFSSLTVIFIYLIGKKYCNKIVAIGASLLFTFSSLNILYAHNARIYGMLVFLATASMYLYFSMIESENKRKYAIVLTIINILIVYSHLMGIFIVFLQACYTVVFKDVRNKIFKEHLISLLIFISTFLPYIFYILPTSYAGLGSVAVGVPTPTFRDLYIFMDIFSNGKNFILFILILSLFGLIVLLTWKKVSVYHKMILGWFIVPYFLMFALAIKFSINVPRFMIFITPGYYLSTILAAYYLTKSKTIGILLTIICVFLMIINTNLNPGEHQRGSMVVEAIERLKSDSTRVYIVPSYVKFPIAYHLNRDIFKDYRNFDKNLNKEQIFMADSIADINPMTLKDVSDVLLIDGWFNLSRVDPQHKIYNMLLNHYKRVNVISQGNIYTGYVIYRFGPRKSINNNY